MKSGDLYERIFETSRGAVGLLTEIEVDGELLHLKDVVVFEESGKVLTGLTQDVLSARTQIIDEAINLGFRTLRISGTRVVSSSSARPGHTVNLLIDLNRYLK